MSKQDRQGARTVADLERRLNTRKPFAEAMGLTKEAKGTADEAKEPLYGELPSRGRLCFICHFRQKHHNSVLCIFYLGVNAVRILVISGIPGIDECAGLSFDGHISSLVILKVAYFDAKMDKYWVRLR